MTEMLPPSHDLPTLEELVGAWSIAPWLAEHYKNLREQNTLMSRLTAVGMVANRFIPNTSRELTMYVDGDHSGALEARVMLWLMAQPPEDMKRASQEAELEVLNLIAEFDKAEAKHWPMPDLLLLATAREMLECSVILLQRRGYVSRIRPMLDAFDAQALKRIPFNKLDAPPFRPMLLLAVRGLTPRKWWGRILGPMS